MVINDIGSTGGTALLCNTDRGPGGNGDSGGYWFAPDGTEVGRSGINNVPGFFRNRGSMVVSLLRGTGPDPAAEGIITVPYWMLMAIIKLFMLDFTTPEMVVYQSVGRRSM